MRRVSKTLRSWCRRALEVGECRHLLRPKLGHSRAAAALGAAGCRPACVATRVEVERERAPMDISRRLVRVAKGVAAAARAAAKKGLG